MSDAPTFGVVARDWEQSLAKSVSSRTDRELSVNSRRIYSCAVERLVKHFGKAPLPITNRMLRDYVTAKRGSLKPATIRTDIIVFKMIHESLTDDDGDFLYPFRLNKKYVNPPKVKLSEQKRICASRADIERALAAPGILPGLVGLCAGVGLRISEALAIRVGDVTGTEDAWDAENSTIHIRRTLKTPSAGRTIYLPFELNSFLASWYRGLPKPPMPGARLFQASRSECYRQLEAAGLPSPHSYRHFRVTEWSEAKMHKGAKEKLIGHSSVKDITERYDHAEENPAFVRSEVERCGLGFSLPVAAQMPEPVPESETVSI